jgi:hypothetical protein
LAARVGNELSASAFVRQAPSLTQLPSGGVAVFFATGPENAYQFEQWRRPLEAYAVRRGVFVVVDRADTGRWLRQVTSLPVAFARSSGELERLVEQRMVAAVLYLNQVEANFRMLRFPGPVHLQLGHGESDKGGSVSNQHKAYDLTLVGGPAGRRRLAAALRNFDADHRTVEIGRPQLDHAYPGAPDWPRGTGRRVLYAPTWEGDRASIAYGSLVSHGLALVAALRADPGVRIIYRPHPRTGQASRAHAGADRTIRRLLAADGDRHLVDEGTYGWQWDFADVCLTDISAVGYDWLATGKPLVVTEPAESTVHRPPSPLLDAVVRLPATRAPMVGEVIAAATESRAVLADLTRYYFGDTRPGASTERFEAALEAAAAQGTIR